MTAATRRLGDAPPAELLDPAERMSVDELRALQLERLQWSLRHAYDNVPRYRARFDEHGVRPADCRELADIAKFPTTTKADLRETCPFGMFAVPRERIARIHASSGTTGRPTVVGYTAGDLDRWAGLVARSIRAAGGRPGAPASLLGHPGLAGSVTPPRRRPTRECHAAATVPAAAPHAAGCSALAPVAAGRRCRCRHAAAAHAAAGSVHGDWLLDVRPFRRQHVHGVD